MRQQINLYAVLPQENKISLTLFKMGVFYSGFFLLLIVISFYQYAYQRYLVHRFTVNQQQLTHLELQIKAIGKQYPSFNSQNPQQFLQALQQALQMKEQLFNLFKQQGYFSSYLKSVAETAPADLWLTEIGFYSLNHRISLKGYALHAEAIQQFIAALENQPVFSNTKLELQNVSQTSISSNSVLFFELVSNVKGIE